jgi:hypothetical protein
MKWMQNDNTPMEEHVANGRMKFTESSARIAPYPHIVADSSNPTTCEGSAYGRRRHEVPCQTYPLRLPEITSIDIIVFAGA